MADWQTRKGQHRAGLAVRAKAPPARTDSWFRSVVASSGSCEPQRQLKKFHSAQEEDEITGESVGFAVEGVGAVLFHHLVVDTHYQERRRPLPEEEGGVVFSAKLCDHSYQHGSASGAEKEAGGQLRRIAFDQRGDLIFFDVACAYTIIRHCEVISLGRRLRFYLAAAQLKKMLAAEA